MHIYALMFNMSFPNVVERCVHQIYIILLLQMHNYELFSQENSFAQHVTWFQAFIIHEYSTRSVLHNSSAPDSTSIAAHTSQ